jgi:hypothetical protein
LPTENFAIDGDWQAEKTGIRGVHRVKCQYYL